MTDRTPTIGATVRDAQTELGKSNISLSVDSQKITTFAYNQDTDKLTYTPSSKLSFGKHTVKVTARDASSLSTTRGWSFKIARPTG
jgi:surface antigen